MLLCIYSGCFGPNYGKEKINITYFRIDNANLPAKKRRAVLNIRPGNNPIAYPTKADVHSEVLVPFWEEDLREEELVNQTSLKHLRQSILFKYSPFTSLSQQQTDVIDAILSGNGSYLIEGGAGTGKTVVLTNLTARLLEQAEKRLKIGVVVQSSWLKSAKQIFDAYSISDRIDVGSAYQILKQNKLYDIIIVDEAHRLRWAYAKQNHVRFDIFDKNAPDKNELFLLGNKASRLVLLYDSLQSIRPSDIPRYDFEKYIDANNFERISLSTQFRVKINDTGAAYTEDDYLNGIKNFLQLDSKAYDKRVFQNTSLDAYFGLVNSIEELFIYTNRQTQLDPSSCNRVLAGYARPWISKKDKRRFDWAGNNQRRWQWNSTYDNWTTRPNSVNEIGCIHAVQGVDLDCVGLIIANDLTFRNGKLIAVKENYYDKNGTPIIKNFTLDELTRYIKNIYYVLLSRGIKGIRIYFEDNSVKEYFMKEAGLL